MAHGRDGVLRARATSSNGPSTWLRKNSGPGATCGRAPIYSGPITATGSGTGSSATTRSRGRQRRWARPRVPCRRSRHGQCPRLRRTCRGTRGCRTGKVAGRPRPSPGGPGTATTLMATDSRPTATSPQTPHSQNVAAQAILSAPQLDRNGDDAREPCHRMAASAGFSGLGVAAGRREVAENRLATWTPLGTPVREPHKDGRLRGRGARARPVMVSVGEREVLGGRLAVPAGHEFERHLLPFVQRRKTGPLDGADMDEHVPGAVLGLDEPITPWRG